MKYFRCWDLFSASSQLMVIWRNYGTGVTRDFRFQIPQTEVRHLTYKLSREINFCKWKFEILVSYFFCANVNEISFATARRRKREFQRKKLNNVIQISRREKTAERFQPKVSYWITSFHSFIHSYVWFHSIISN